MPRPVRRRKRQQDDALELVVAAVAALNPDEMSPREAMEALYVLKLKLARAKQVADSTMMNVAESKHSDGAGGRANAGSTALPPRCRRRMRRPRRRLFLPDGLWRDVLAFTWTIETASGSAAIEETLRANARRAPSRRIFIFRRNRTPPRWVSRAGTECIEAIFEFETAFGPAHGVVRLVPTRKRRRLARLDADHDICRNCAATRTLSSAAPGRGRRIARFRRRQLARPPRRRARLCRPRSGGRSSSAAARPDCRIAARLQQLGIDTLIVDRHERVGDNWRNRYHSLTLHNEVHVNHLPYMPFPPTFPVYIPKDKLANWFESYVEALELNFWTGTELAAGSYDDRRKSSWTVTLRRADGTTRVMHPRHLIFATGVSSIPGDAAICPASTILPASKCIPAPSRTRKPGAAARRLVLGTGTSGHDVAQELHAHGADVTMIQRSKTYVVSLKEAQSVYAIYSEGIPFEDCDLLATSFPYPVLQRSYQLSTARGIEVDKALIAALDKRGFRQWAGEDETGFQMMYLRRGGGYYFNVGCSDLIISGAIKLLQFADIEQFVAAGREAERRPHRAGRTAGAGDRLQEPAGHRACLSRRRRSPTKSVRSGASMRAANCATCGGAPRSRACGSPPAASRNAGSSRVIWRSRSRRWKKGYCSNFHCRRASHSSAFHATPMPRPAA